MGEADFVKETLEKLGSMSFWKIAMKPGRPLTHGKLGRAAFFGLPGNPVAATEGKCTLNRRSAASASIGKNAGHL